VGAAGNAEQKSPKTDHCETPCFFGSRKSRTKAWRMEIEEGQQLRGLARINKTPARASAEALS
jgi:hypothetical protein